MTLSIPSANVSLLDRYDRSLASEGPELTRRPTFDGDIPPVEGINAGLTEELPVPGTKEKRTCRTCGKDTINYQLRHGRLTYCNPCKAFQSRMEWEFRKNEGLRKSWREMSASQKNEWYQTSELHMVYRTDLAKAMALHIEKSGPTWDDIKPYFRKCLRDSPELKRRYKGRSDLRRQIKRRSAKVFDERRQCVLYEDYDFCRGEPHPKGGRDNDTTACRHSSRQAIQSQTVQAEIQGSQSLSPTVR